MFGRDNNKTKADGAVLPPAAAPAAPAAPSAPAASASSAVPDRPPGDSMIGPHLTLKGEINFEDGLTIEGGVEGKVSGQGALTVGPNGRVLGDVMAASILIRGRVQGHITAADRLEVAPTAIIIGDIHAARLAVAEGARLMGRVEIDCDSLSMPMTKSQDALEKIL